MLGVAEQDGQGTVTLNFEESTDGTNFAAVEVHNLTDSPDGIPAA